MNKMLIAIVRQAVVEDVLAELKREGIRFSFYAVKGYGKEIRLYHEDIHDRVKIEIITGVEKEEKIKEIILKNISPGKEGEGILAVINVEEYLDFSEIPE
jgi:nitrogen regulatory protein PII